MGQLQRDGLANFEDNDLSCEETLRWPVVSSGETCTQKSIYHEKAEHGKFP